ncbi:toxin of the ChpA-ChpR toxin-antitoxin system, endoribonuclease [Syntrophobacter sp. SbD1]|nr:toxin of the ChpA-ChpR toxin-antitoxin system, endoribonuclease [Syntrophobacter sp. SbD1]
MSQKLFFPRRGDVITVDLDPVTGHEQGGRRPALVLSAEDYNRVVGLAVVVQITLKAKGYPFEVQIPQRFKVKGTILADHIECIDWRGRNAEHFDTLPEEVLEEVGQKLGPLIFP